MILVNSEDVVVELEFQSLETVNLIKDEDISSHEFGVIIEDIRQILTTKLTIKIRHVFQEIKSIC